MGLSPEEERHIQNLSVIPAALVFYVFLGYIIYTIKTNPSLSDSFFLGYLWVYFFVVFPVTFLSTEQVLRSRREKLPLAFYKKRFVGSMAIFAIGGALFGTVWAMVNLSMASLVDWSKLMVATYAITIIVFVFIIFKFRDRFDRLSKGNW